MTAEWWLQVTAGGRRPLCLIAQHFKTILHPAKKWTQNGFGGFGSKVVNWKLPFSTLKFHTRHKSSCSHGLYQILMSNSESLILSSIVYRRNECIIIYFATFIVFPVSCSYRENTSLKHIIGRNCGGWGYNDKISVSQWQGTVGYFSLPRSGHLIVTAPTITRTKH